MKELHNELHRHYGLLLGIKSPWGVSGVKLDMAGKRVEIGLEWAQGHGVPCADCGRKCTMADHAPERTWRHLENILTYLRHSITNAVTEGLNSKIQSLKSNARGFRSFQNYRTRILFFCGKLSLQPL